MYYAGSLFEVTITENPDRRIAHNDMGNFEYDRKHTLEHCVHRRFLFLLKSPRAPRHLMQTARAANHGWNFKFVQIPNQTDRWHHQAL